MTSPTTSVDPSKTVGQLVVENPARSRVFEQYQIDYCCGGKRPLTEACEKRELNIDQVLEDLLQADNAGAQPMDTDVASMTLSELINHIVSTHHDHLRTELPRLEAMANKVKSVHGDNHSWLIPLHETVVALVEELTSHMLKEEDDLFPVVRLMEEATAAPGVEVVGDHITDMEDEHDSAGAALEKLRELSCGYTPPQGACNTFRALLDGLDELEQEMHLHIHKENNILFPRALAMATQR